MFIHKRQVKHQNISAITIYETKTFSFLQHEGPGQSHYDLKIPSASSAASCFQSRVPRFLPACSVSVLKDRHSCRVLWLMRGVEWALRMGWGAEGVIYNSSVQVCVLSCFSCVLLIVTLWTIVHQARLSRVTQA